MDSLHGKLLIAGATLADPNFQRAVVLVCQHNEQGAMGLILNRVGAARVAERARRLRPLLGDEATIDEGGPVNSESMLVVAEFEDPSVAGWGVFGSVGIVGDGLEIDELADVVLRARVFAGYAGWGPGQLDAELQRDDWIVEPADIDDVFGPEPVNLWQRVLTRKGGSFAIVARMPIDPSVN